MSNYGGAGHEEDDEDLLNADVSDAPDDDDEATEEMPDEIDEVSSGAILPHAVSSTCTNAHSWIIRMAGRRGSAGIALKSRNRAS